MNKIEKKIKQDLDRAVERANKSVLAASTDKEVFEAYMNNVEDIYSTIHEGIEEIHQDTLRKTMYISMVGMAATFLLGVVLGNFHKKG